MPHFHAEIPGRDTLPVKGMVARTSGVRSKSQLSAGSLPLGSVWKSNLDQTIGAKLNGKRIASLSPGSSV